MSFRLRPSNARTSSRAVLALAGRSTTSVTPVLEVTVNFMAHSPNCTLDVDRRPAEGPDQAPSVASQAFGARVRVKAARDGKICCLREKNRRRSAPNFGFSVSAPRRGGLSCSKGNPAPIGGRRGAVVLEVKYPDHKSAPGGGARSTNTKVEPESLEAARVEEPQMIKLVTQEDRQVPRRLYPRAL